MTISLEEGGEEVIFGNAQMPLSITKISDFGVYFGIIAYRNFPFWKVFAEVSFLSLLVSLLSGS